MERSLLPCSIWSEQVTRPAHATRGMEQQSHIAQGPAEWKEQTFSDSGERGDITGTTLMGDSETGREKAGLTGMCNLLGMHYTEEMSQRPGESNTGIVDTSDEVNFLWAMISEEEKSPNSLEALRQTQSIFSPLSIYPWVSKKVDRTQNIPLWHCSLKGKNKWLSDNIGRWLSTPSYSEVECQSWVSFFKMSLNSAIILQDEREARKEGKKRGGMGWFLPPKRKRKSKNEKKYQRNASHYRTEK